MSGDTFVPQAWISMQKTAMSWVHCSETAVSRHTVTEIVNARETDSRLNLV